MYSMVLLAALTTTVDTPDFGRRGGGCCGCYGGGWGGCYGGWGGCYGGCYGGWGGCYGGCYGWGGWGGGYGGYYAAAPSYYTPTYAALPMTTGTPVVMGNGTQPYQSFYAGPNGRTNLRDRARLIVNVPANARVMVDGESTQANGSSRVFLSPPLQPGKTYHYKVQATVNEGGEPITQTKDVQVWAGKTSEQTFNFNNAGENNRRENLKNPPAAAEEEENFPPAPPAKRPIKKEPIKR